MGADRLPDSWLFRHRGSSPTQFVPSSFHSTTAGACIAGIPSSAQPQAVLKQLRMTTALQISPVQVVKTPTRTVSSPTTIAQSIPFPLINRRSRCPASSNGRKLFRTLPSDDYQIYPCDGHHSRTPWELRSRSLALARAKDGAIRRKACSTHHLVVLVGLLDGYSHPIRLTLRCLSQTDQSALSSQWLLDEHLRCDFAVSSPLRGSSSFAYAG